MRRIVDHEAEALERQYKEREAEKARGKVRVHDTGPQYELLEGCISRLLTERTHVHYLESLKELQPVAGAMAVLQAAIGEAGAVASSQVASYEGDPVDGFLMNVAGHPVHGSFWKTTFKEGDHVQVIGQKHGGIFEAVAVTKPDERIIWMLPHCERGTRSQTKNLLKWSGWFVVLMLCFSMYLTFFREWPAWLSFLLGTLNAALILSITVGMGWSDFMLFAREMNAVGKALGAPEPESLDLFQSTKLARKSGRPDLPMGVFYY